MDQLDKLSETQLYSLRTLKTPRIGRTVAKVLIVVTCLFIMILFLPISFRELLQLIAFLTTKISIHLIAF